MLLSDHDRKGKIVLNRPKQLNALNHSMVKKLSATLRKWKYDKSLIIVKGKNLAAKQPSRENSFCFRLIFKATVTLRGIPLGIL